MKTLLLIDANGLIHRSFHALPPLTAPDGRPTGALYGLARLLVKTLADEHPDYIAACFDRPEPTFRKQKYPEYKAHRPPAPDELIKQIVEARELIQTFHIPVVELPGYEADDLIGTLAVRFASNDLHVTILTGDLDSLQLVRNGLVSVAGMKTGVSEIIRYDEAKVAERFGVRPDQLADYKGLAGDASDNIPGVKGVGPKTAVQLLTEFRTLDRLFAEMPEEHKLAKKVLPYRDAAFLSRDLGRIATDAPLAINIEELRYQVTDPERLRAYLISLGFESIVKQLEKHTTDNLRPTTTSQKQEARDLPTRPTELSGRAGQAGERRAQTNERVLVVLDAAEAGKLGKELQSDAVKVTLEWKPILKSLDTKLAVSDPLFDLSIAGWLLDPDQHDYSLATLATTYLLPPLQVNTPPAVARDLYATLSQKLREEKLDHLARDLEFPLIRILAEMEQVGVLVDVPALAYIKTELTKKIEKLEADIYAAAGAPFNVNSPRQVGEVLFDQLHLGTGRQKKTATGQYRTSVDILAALREAHPIVPLLLRHREDSKVLSGFVEPLLSLIAPDGRIHTTYLQTTTGTGRLASERPNLQNIPQESEWAKPLRDAFVASPGSQFLSLDYSQVELRILAHVTQDPGLTEAFRTGTDIHTATAARTFGVTEDRVTKEMRRIGKTLNFGVVYGMGARAFGETSGIPLAEARRFIEEYFVAFPTIRSWQAKIKLEAQTTGVIRNEHGRRRLFPPGRNFGEFERAAINMPIQSLAADIIKQAMIDTTRIIHKREWSGGGVRLILSIHDELLFEVPDGIVDTVVPVLRETMERAAALSVPLRVDATVGPAWGSLTPHR
ncbi:MAG: DNA polymerase [bacterium]|nr:DNA polymerase [bacterium]